MPVTMKQVRAALDPDEVDYAAAARLGPDAFPHLETLVAGDDPGLAAKAAYLAGRIRDERSAGVLERAAANRDARVRVAAAAAARDLPADAASRILTNLVLDADAGVQKLALGSVPDRASPELRATLERLSRTARNTALRTMSKDVLRRLP